MQEAASSAYAEQDYKTTEKLLTELQRRDPRGTRWLEMRAQVMRAQHGEHKKMIEHVISFTGTCR